MIEGVRGVAIKFRAAHPKAFAALIVRMRRLREAGAFVTRYKSFKNRLMRERQALLDAIGIRWINLDRMAEAAAALGIFARKQVAFASVSAHDFAGAGGS